MARKDDNMTTVSLKDYIDREICNLQKNIKHLEDIINDKFKTQTEINSQSDKVLNERLGHMNEFREQLNSERSRYITKEYFDMRFTPIESQQLLNQGGKAMLYAVISFSLSTITFLMLVWRFLFK